MAKAIFTTKISPTYDDLPEVRYHFPKTYLNQVQQVLGDWIVYYEPRRPDANLNKTGGRQTYFATARIKEITADPLRPDHFYAIVTDYLDFDRDVPFKEGTYYYESILEKNDGSTNKGAFGRAVRILPDAEYDRILHAGYAPIIEEGKQNSPDAKGRGLYDPPAEFERPIVEQVVKRPFRDAAFAKLVKDVYQQTCAMTGLQIINGGGRSEVQAAHIMPVASNGPDTVRNGIALCQTVHWMFDRGLLSVDDDYTVLKAKGKIPPPVERLLEPTGKLIVPQNEIYMPHPHYLKFHRENVFKG